MLAGDPAVARDRVGGDPAEPSGLPHAAALGDVLQHRLDLLRGGSRESNNGVAPCRRRSGSCRCGSGASAATCPGRSGGVRSGFRPLAWRSRSTRNSGSRSERGRRSCRPGRAILGKDVEFHLTREIHDRTGTVQHYCSIVTRRSRATLKNDRTGLGLRLRARMSSASGATGMNGPPLVIYGTLRGWSPPALPPPPSRATSSPPASSVLGGYWLDGPLDPRRHPPLPRGLPGASSSPSSSAGRPTGASTRPHSSSTSTSASSWWVPLLFQSIAG